MVLLTSIKQYEPRLPGWGRRRGSLSPMKRGEARFAQPSNTGFGDNWLRISLKSSSMHAINFPCQFGYRVDKRASKNAE